MSSLQISKKSTNQTVEHTVGVRTVLRVIIIAVISFGVLAAMNAAKTALVLIGIALFLALALNAPVHWLSRRLPGKKRNNRNMATAISIIVVLLLLVGFIVAIVPPLVSQTVSFVQNLPELVKNTREGSGPIGQFVTSHNLESHVEKLANEMSGRVSELGSSALSTVSSIGASIITGIVSVLTVIVLVIMMLIEGPSWAKIFVEVIPAEKRPRMKKIANDMYRVVNGYVNGQVMLAAMAALLITPVFFIMGVKYPLALMVVVFICGLIPMVGHTIGGAICTIVALFTSLPAALVVLAYYVIYQQIENYTLQPKIQSNATNMSPLLVFSSVLVGATLGGLLGGLLAIPIAGCIRVLLLDYMEERGILSRQTVRRSKTKKVHA